MKNNLIKILLSAGFVFLLIMSFPGKGMSLPKEQFVSRKAMPGAFPLVTSTESSSLWVSPEDYPGVLRVAGHLKTDIARVTGRTPDLIIQKKAPRLPLLIVAGTAGKNPVIDKLIKEGRIDPLLLTGKRETYVLTVIEHPLRGVEKALVIAGSDKRGTIYGLYELSSQIGVTPLHFWADVPVIPSDQLYVLPGKYTLGEPKVYYRGLFINDEAPALADWVHEKFGGFNSRFYEHVFEYIMRLKGNFLWPAMWGRAFYDDDPQNPLLADEYGVVIGTSHHELLMRAHVEWARYGEGEWNYQTNKEVLQKFWRHGLERMGTNESVVTVGMRGDGDEPMSRESNMALLEQIIKDQRQIIEEVTGKPAAETPQMWALYKEVQDYYDQGMRVPDDVTLMLCDDNWGNVRKLPNPQEPRRSGGYGMYYHFDYVGGPRNYKWLNTNTIPRIWEQMDLCWKHNVDRIWIVNVGDIKPMEYPLEFFLDMAWDPAAMTIERMSAYDKEWTRYYFGPTHADGIARLLTDYSRLSGRRKPELINPLTFSLINYNEAERVVREYNELEKEAQEIYESLLPEYKDAYYQLVLFPIVASANLYELYVTAALNGMYTAQGRACAPQMAEKATALFEKDSLLTLDYHTKLANGKWNHMMSQTHIGYTYWQQPPFNAIPRLFWPQVSAQGEIKAAIEGHHASWPGDTTLAVTPVLNPYDKTSTWIELFNTGSAPRNYRVETSDNRLVLSSDNGTLNGQERLMVSVRWDDLPYGLYDTQVTIHRENGLPIVITVPLFHPNPAEYAVEGAFVESNGYIVAEAEHFSRNSGGRMIHWNIIPGLGRTLSGLRTEHSDVSGIADGEERGQLEYDMVFFTSDTVELHLLFSPTLDFYGRGLRYEVSFDDNEFQVIDIHRGYTLRDWERWVADNVIRSVTRHVIDNPGLHTLRIRAVDPFLVLQRIEINAGGLKPSYLGPPESYRYIP